MLANTCRTCASIVESSNLENIHQPLPIKQDEIVKIIEALQICFSLSFSQSKTFPQQICLGCLADLKSAYEFWQKSKRSELLFASILKESNPNEQPSNESPNLCSRKSKRNDENTACQAEHTRLYSIEDSTKSFEYLEESFLDQDYDGSVTKPERQLYEEQLDAELSMPIEALEEDDDGENDTNSVTSVPIKLEIKTEPIDICSDDDVSVAELKKEDCSELAADTSDGNVVSTTTANVIKRVKYVEKRNYGNAYNCSICNSKFKKRCEYQDHLTNHTSDELKIYSCHICGKRFKSNAILSAHMTVHNPERPFSCDICGKTFKMKSNLSTHMTLHNGKPHLCSNCGKRFSTAGDLANHFRRHTGEKPYKCDKCSARYMQKSHLSTHMETHVIGKPQLCKICGKSYKTRECLRIHMFKHNGYPYYCSICARPFIKKYLLKRHLKFTHGTCLENAERVNECDQTNFQDNEDFDMDADNFPIEYLDESVDNI